MAANGRKEENSRPASLHLEINLTLEIGQVMLSLLHAWGLDKDLDKVAISKLGLLRPQVNIILLFYKITCFEFFQSFKNSWETLLSDDKTVGDDLKSFFQVSILLLQGVPTSLGYAKCNVLKLRKVCK